MVGSGSFGSFQKPQNVPSGACAKADIEHRTTKPRHPWTNGQVERMNRTIKEATVKRFYYESHDQLRHHLGDLIKAYNLGRRLKTLKALPHTSSSAESGQDSQNDSTSIQPIKCRD
jgi:transposase InsO family protein